jgi:hypothetical protein
VNPAVRLKHPRLFGLVLLAAGLVLNFMNWNEITTHGRYWLVGLLAGPLGTLLGLWRIGIGQPWDDKTNRMQRWAAAGDTIACALGLGISALVVTWIFRHSSGEQGLLLACALGVGALGALYFGVREWRAKRA